MSHYYTIEHSSRGYYTEGQWEYVKGILELKPHFAWSVTSNNERVRHFFSESEALAELEKFPEKIRNKCRVRREVQ